MDRPCDFATRYYVIPRGQKNEGLPGGHTWESKCGTVVLAGAMNPGGPIKGAFDGMNEKGLGATSEARLPRRSIEQPQRRPAQ